MYIVYIDFDKSYIRDILYTNYVHPFGQEIVPKQEEEEPEETTDIIEALKASLKVKGKSSTSAAAKAKGKMGITVSK
jgi:hypothetical protein